MINLCTTAGCVWYVVFGLVTRIALGDSSNVFPFLGISYSSSVNEICSLMFRYPLLKINQCCKEDVITKMILLRRQIFVSYEFVTKIKQEAFFSYGNLFEAQNKREVSLNLMSRTYCILINIINDDLRKISEIYITSYCKWERYFSIFVCEDLSNWFTLVFLWNVH